MLAFISKLIDALPNLVVTLENNQFGAKAVLALGMIVLAIFALFVALQLLK